MYGHEPVATIAGSNYYIYGSGQGFVNDTHRAVDIAHQVRSVLSNINGLSYVVLNVEQPFGWPNN